MSFLDSHARVQAMAGYGFLKIARVSANWRLGAGYTLFLMSRKDIMDYVPFPGILPLVSVQYRKASVNATYIPGKKGTGNVLRSEEHTSELQSLMRISYAVFCLKKKK